MRAIRLFVGTLFSVLLFGQAAHAELFYGGVAYATNRHCTALTDRCDGTIPGQQIVDSAISGGFSTLASTDLTLGDGSFARGWTAFGVSDLPSIHGETLAAGDNRMNINIVAFQSYTYTGPSGTPFSISGTLHIVDSSVSPPDGTDSEGPVEGSVLPGGARYFTSIGLWDTSVIDPSMTPLDMVGLLGVGCGSPGVLGYTSSFDGLSGGERNIDLTTASCDASPLTLTTGQEILVAAVLQLPVNRGGWIDATSSFITRLGDDLTEDQKTVLASSLISATSVPEPGSWAMMIGGLLLSGGMMRARPRRPRRVPSLLRSS